MQIKSWYKRSEFGLRAAIFFSAATVSGAFGGLLAVGVIFDLAPFDLTSSRCQAAISNMEGVGGRPAWAWIFSAYFPEYLAIVL